MKPTVLDTVSKPLTAIWLSLIATVTYWPLFAIAAPNHSTPIVATPVKTVPKAYSLAQLTDMALMHNPQTRIVWGQIKAAAAAEGISKSAYWPQLEVNLQMAYPNSCSGDTDDNNVYNCYGSEGIQYTPSLSISYLLLDFGNRKQQVKNAHYQYLATRLNADETVQQIILQVDQAYYQLLGQQALLQANTISLKEAQISYDAASALHKHGLATIGDVYQAKSALAQAELTLQQTQGALGIAQGQLAMTIGIPLQTPLPIADLPSHDNLQPIMQSISHYLNRAKQQRPDLLAAQAQVTAAQAQYKAVKAQALPTLAVTSSLQQTYQHHNGVDNGSTVMLTLNYPLFTGFEQTYNERQALAQVQTAAATRDNLANQIAFTTWQAYYNLQTAYNSIHSSDVFLQSSIEAAKQALGQYKAGVGDILSVLSTQTSEANARVQSIQARLNWYTALAELTAALGSLTTTPPTLGDL